MSAATPVVRDLSRQLVALEGVLVPNEGPAAGGAAARVIEKLRLPLVRLAGAAGFRALLSRAVSLAKREEPSLDAIEILPDGGLDGLDRLGQHEGADGGVVVAHLLGLLMVFVGESLMLGLVRDAWPGARLNETDAGPGRQS